MVAHQATTRNPNTGFGGASAQPLQISRAVLIVKKHVLALVAALGDVMRQMGEDSSGGTGHGATMAWRGGGTKGNVPFIPDFSPAISVFDDLSAWTECLLSALARQAKGLSAD